MITVFSTRRTQKILIVALTLVATTMVCDGDLRERQVIAASVQAQPKQTTAPLIAYVGTFSSPLRDVLPTQVDLPPGNGRGIHLFEVNRSTGALTPRGVYESGASPSCLALNSNGMRLYSTNETDHVGEKNEGTVSA